MNTFNNKNVTLEESFCNMEYDLVVVGGGPAGATFARLVNTRYRVVVLDRKENITQPMPDEGCKNRQDCMTEDSREKCCGGLLAPDAQRELAIQGLTLPLHVLVDPQIFAVRTIDLGANTSHSPLSIERYYQRSYVNIHRANFDRWLLMMLPEGRHIDGAVVKAIHRIRGGFQVFYRRQGKTYTMTTRYIVGADGGNSLVRRTFYPRAAIPRYVAVQEWYEADDKSPFYGALFDREITDCYGWLVSKNNRLLLGAAFPQDNAVQRFALLKEKLITQGYSFGQRVRRQGCIVCRPKGLSDLCIGGDGVFLIGEAAGFISPSSLEGISYALKSGARLANAMQSSLNDTTVLKYYKSTRVIRLQLLGKLIKNPFLYQPTIRRFIMRSGISSLPVQVAPQNQPPILTKS